MRKKILSLVTAFAMVIAGFPSMDAVKATKAAESADTLPKPAYCWEFENLSDGTFANNGTVENGPAALKGTAEAEKAAVSIGGKTYKNEENTVLTLNGGGKGTSYVDLPQDMYQGVTAETGLTYSFWIKPDSSVGSYARVISSTNENSGNEFAFAPYAEDKVWNVLFDDGMDAIHAPMPSEPEKDVWSFVIFTIDADEIVFYVNGEEKGSYPSTNLVKRLDNMSTLINNALGKTCSGWGDPDAKVKLDDVCLYKMALSQREAVVLAKEQGFEIQEKAEAGGANELTDGTKVTDTGLTVNRFDITAKIVEDKETGRYFITAERNGTVLLDASQLGVKTDIDFTQDMSYVADTAKTIDGKDEYTLTTGAKRNVSDEYSELSFQLKKDGTEKEITIYIRVYKDGVAYRYEWSGAAGTAETISGEASEFVLPADSVIWAGYDEAGNYEYEYQQRLKMSSVKSASAKYSVPLLANSGGNWMLFTEASVFSEPDTYCASHLETSAGTRNLKFVFGKNSGSSISMTYNEEGKIHTPWRVVMMADHLNDIVNATMTSSLNPAADETLYKDSSQWIKTGMVAWSWWSEAGDDPIEYDQQKDYIDFAAENGWEYVCLDFGWCLWEDYKEKVKELVEYAKEKDVGVLLWYGVNNRNHQDRKDAQGDPAYPKYSLQTTEQLKEQFTWCESVGVKGVKVDYYERDDKDTMKQMYECATIAAEHKLNVLFHGCTAPRGEIRTFPNVLGYEAVRGSEYYKWNIGPSINNCLTYVFNRNVVGGMDFTPVGTQIDQLPVTAGFQLAQVIAYQTGLQNIASSVYKLEGYQGLSMINDIPTQWDETILLNGDPGKKITIARRNGEDWYIAAMTAAAGKEKISLDFLDDGNYKAYIYKDNAKGTDVEIEEKEVTKTSALELTLAENGGAAVKISKNTMVTTTAYDQYTYYEAEDADRSGNTAVSKNQFASGMQQVTGLGGTAHNNVTFSKIIVPEDGVYEMRLYYACGVDRRVVYTVNGEDEIRSCKLNAGVNTLAMQKFYVSLKKGENRISFGNIVSKAPNIDRIAISNTTVDKPATVTDSTDDGEKPIDGSQYDYTLYGPDSAALTNAVIENNAIGWLGGNPESKAAFKVNVGQAGKYKLQINYCTGETRDVYITVNSNEEEIRCICPSTGSYTIDSAESIYTDIVLEAGENTIVLGNASAHCPNIASIGISKNVVSNDNNDNELADYEALNKEVANAQEKFASLKEEDYTPESYKALKDALEQALALQKDAVTKKEQEKVDAATAMLQKAIEGLKEKSPEENNNSGGSNNSGGTVNNGSSVNNNSGTVDNHGNSVNNGSSSDNTGTTDSPDKTNGLEEKPGQNAGIGTGDDTVNVDSVIRTGSADETGTINISEALLKDAAKNNENGSVVIEITDTTINSVAANGKRTTVTVNIPSIEGVEIGKVVLTKESIQAVKSAKKELAVNVVNHGSGDNYIVTIPVKQIAKIDPSVEEVNINVVAEPVADVADNSKKAAITKIISQNSGKEEKTHVVSLASNENVNIGMKVTVPISNKTTISAGSKVYVYKYDAKTGKLIETANCRQTVSMNGSVTIAAVSGTDYVVSAKKLNGKKVETIKGSISVSISKRTAKAGKILKVKISLPDTVSTKSKFGAEKAVITYKSSNKKIASVSKKGSITTKKKGTVTITTTVKLASGQKVTKKQKLIVK